jgi:catechol 2,3-dioxygenase-like lactoylglutathione lyase family enzyme
MAVIDGLDHVIIGVADLEEAHRRWQRLGFTVTPRGRHKGWGTANYCTMFRDGYVELLGVVDPAEYTYGLDRFLVDHGEGLIGLAYETADAARTVDGLTGLGLAGDPPRALSRLLELPEGTVEPEFRLVHPEPRDALGGGAFVVQHLTPAMIRRADWLDHPNGARRLALVTVAVADPAAVAETWRRVVGPASVAEDADGATVRVGTGVVHFGRAEPGMREGPVGIAVAVADPERTARALEAGGIPFERGAEGIDVAPAEANGVALSFLDERRLG